MINNNNNNNLLFKIIIIIIIISLSFVNSSKQKYYIVESYTNSNCDGQVAKYNVLLLNNEYCFGVTGYLLYVNCNGDFKDNPSDCFISSSCHCNLENNNQTCKTYVNLNQCFKNEIDGDNIYSKIVYNKLNYLEKDYCSLSESYNTSLKDSARYKLDGAQIYKKNHCFGGVYSKCDLKEVVFKDCKSSSSFLVLASHVMTHITRKDYPGTWILIPNDINFLIKPVNKEYRDKSNFIFNPNEFKLIPSNGISIYNNNNNNNNLILIIILSIISLFSI